jgi:hypothetical protein
MEAEMEFANSIELKRQHKEAKAKLLANQELMNQPSTSGVILTNGAGSHELPSSSSGAEATTAAEPPK